MIGKRDRRIWTPDETCEPIHFEAGIVGTAHGYLGEFTIARGMTAVWTYAYTFGGNVTKAVTRIVITDTEEFDAQTGLIDDRASIAMNGALQNVREVAPDANRSRVGFLVAISPGVGRPCRLILEGGRRWFVLVLGTGVGAVQSASIVLDGYAFRDVDR